MFDPLPGGKLDGGTLLLLLLAESVLLFDRLTFNPKDAYLEVVLLVDECVDEEGTGGAIELFIELPPPIIGPPIIGPPIIGPPIIGPPLELFTEWFKE